MAEDGFKLTGLSAERWSVERGAFTGKKGARIRLPCHHRADSACPGCYARLYAALQLIKVVPQAASVIVEEVEEALRAEEAAWRLGGKRR